MPALMSPEVMASRRNCAINSGVAGAAREVAAFAINAKVASLRLLTIIYHIWFEFKSYIIMGLWPEKRWKLKVADRPTRDPQPAHSEDGATASLTRKLVSFDVFGTL